MNHFWGACTVVVDMGTREIAWGTAYTGFMTHVACSSLNGGLLPPRSDEAASLHPERSVERRNNDSTQEVSVCSSPAVRGGGVPW